MKMHDGLMCGRGELDLKKLSDQEILSLYSRASSALSYYEGMQQTVKRLANSVYGACGSAYFRFCNFDVAEDITTEGKYYLFAIDKAINRYFQNLSGDEEMQAMLSKAFGHLGGVFLSDTQDDVCFYGDTDSRMIDYGMVMRQCGLGQALHREDAIKFVLLFHKHRIGPLILRESAEYVERMRGEAGTLKMELEVIAAKAIMLASKKYVMSILYEDNKDMIGTGKLKARGVELIQSSTSTFVKKMQIRALRIMLSPRREIKDAFSIVGQVAGIGKAAVSNEGAENADAAENESIAHTHRDLCKITTIKDYAKYVLDEKSHVFGDHTPIAVRAAAYYNAAIKEKGLAGKYELFEAGMRIYWYYCAEGSRFDVFGFPESADYDPSIFPEMDKGEQIRKLITEPMKRFVFDPAVDKNSLGGSVMQKTFAVGRKCAVAGTKPNKWSPENKWTERFY